MDFIQKNKTNIITGAVLTAIIIIIMLVLYNEIQKIYEALKKMRVQQTTQIDNIIKEKHATQIDNIIKEKHATQIEITEKERPTKIIEKERPTKITKLTSDTAATVKPINKFNEIYNLSCPISELTLISLENATQGDKLSFTSVSEGKIIKQNDVKILKFLKFAQSWSIRSCAILAKNDPNSTSGRIYFGRIFGQFFIFDGYIEVIGLLPTDNKIKYSILKQLYSNISAVFYGKVMPLSNVMGDYLYLSSVRDINIP